jgi:hypothetical protein
MSERRNAWGRGPDGKERNAMPPSLADDQKNKFDRNADVTAARRADTTVHDARVEKIAEQNTRWVNKNLQLTAAGGTRLTPSLAKDKAASDTSRTAPAAAPNAINLGTVAACVAFWKQHWPNGKLLYELYEDNDFNRQQLTEATQHLLQQGHTVDVQLAEDAFMLCYQGNHLDPKRRRDRAGNIVHLRGEAGRPAPVPFPHRVIWPDEAAAIEREQKEKALATAAVETARAKSLPFDQLKKEATKDRKPERPLMGPVISVGN